MTKQATAKKIQKILNEIYPEPPIPLQHRDSYTLLIAVLLSAHCTDARVNKVTPVLFAKASTPEEMVKLSVEEIENIIRTCGLGPRKSKAIWELSHILINEHQGKVPDSFEALEALPGVGHKTASVVMSHAFNKAAFPVDTHIHRCAKRWGLSNGKNVKQTEKDLKELFPKKDWNRLHLQIIYFGREYCQARNHTPSLCPICSWASNS
ncbi:endonuclease III [Candidatus Protochlamydia naegleriophila]|uniref:Endonuclease III n=1 Tax=Candidatus Protochlamydia naegleriophila TaxID=389348 RepID=A0A0U5JFH8_9BACT|nr:endonuclease III [Candidatus Protochlamydia naegleriophila]CUI17927.1 endonuclease III [Candidatus Protochlamydia naegleriophila]